MNYFCSLWSSWRRIAGASVGVDRRSIAFHYMLSLFIDGNNALGISEGFIYGGESVRNSIFKLYPC